MDTTHDYRPTGRAGAPRSPLAWLNQLGLRRSDLAFLGADLRLQGGSVLAQHRDAGGLPLGIERISADLNGRLRYSYTHGARRGLFRAVPSGTRRLVVAEGALPAAAVAALDKRCLPTAYAGGGWCDIAATAVRSIVQMHRIETVVLAVASTPVGARAAERALEDLTGLEVHVEVVEAPLPGGTWLSALTAARGVAESPR
jgi:hypothetical protein